MKPKLTPFGYLWITLAHDGRYRTVPVHHLVLRAFVGTRPKGHQTRHLNGVRTDNRLANLRWGTPRENCADRERHGTVARGARNGAYTKPRSRAVGSRSGRRKYPERYPRGERVNTAKLTVAQVRKIRAIGGKVRDVAKMFGVSKSLVSLIRRRESWAHV